MSLGQWLIEERERRGLTYEEFAELCKISVTALRYIERTPDVDPGLSVIMNFADGLNIPRWQMLEHAGYPSGRDQTPRLTPEQLDAVLDAAIEEMNESVRGPVRDAKKLLANLLRLPQKRKKAR